MTRTVRPRRWPAYALAVLLCGYAAGKAVFAVQARLGFPGGPPVSAATNDNYFLAPAVGQWFACATGLAGAAVALATVTDRGRRSPQWLLPPVLAVMTLSILGGGGIMATDGFIGIGVGWNRYHGVVGLAAIALCLETIRSYLAVTSHGGPAAGLPARTGAGSARPVGRGRRVWCVTGGRRAFRTRA